MEPIGHVATATPDADVARTRRTIESDIVIDARWEDALDGIEDYSHLIVLFWMHRRAAGSQPLRARPRGRGDLPETGVLAARGRNHPNAIGLAVVELIERAGRRLRVRRLDAYDGSPVIDIKPYDPYDVVADPRVPAWWAKA
jgi:tRNA-Thr(GGU) m(6)t(6)A37 methyltransferase TsaA